MTEHIEEQILSNLKTSLEAITEDNGTTYWYTPSAVARVEQYPSPTEFQIGYPIAYFIRDTSESTPGPLDKAFGDDAYEFVVFVLGAFHDPAVSRNIYVPHASIALPGTIRNRMIQDVRTAVYQDKRLGLSASVLTTEVLDVTKDFEQGVKRWILVEVPVSVVYHESHEV